MDCQPDRGLFVATSKPNQVQSIDTMTLSKGADAKDPVFDGTTHAIHQNDSASPKSNLHVEREPVRIHPHGGADYLPAPDAVPAVWIQFLQGFHQATLEIVERPAWSRQRLPCLNRR